MRQAFDQSLADLCQKTDIMFYRIYTTFRDTFDVIENNDNILAKDIVAQDVSINELEAHINEDALRLILKQSPVASDLRLIIITIKIAYELERMGDYAKNICTYIIHNPQDTKLIRKAMLSYKSVLLKMLQGIRIAFQKRDGEMARAVSKKDDYIDSTYKAQVHTFINFTKDRDDIPTDVVSLALITIKQFERAGDHITNIAEHIHYYNRAKFIDLNT